MFGIRKPREKDTRSPNMVANPEFTVLADSSPINIVFFNLNYRIVYINKTARDLLDGLDENLFGKSIVGFHENPEILKQILASPMLLPANMLLTFGEEIFSGLVSVINDDFGIHVGYMLTLERVIHANLDRVKLSDHLREIKSLSTRISDNVNDLSRKPSTASEERNLDLKQLALELGTMVDKTQKLLP